VTWDKRAYGRVEVELQRFITSALDDGKWLASCYRHFTLGKHRVTVASRLFYSKRNGFTTPDTIFNNLKKLGSKLIS
jgi:hypothetical protein